MKLGLVGAGQIGGVIALLAAMERFEEIALFDVVEGLAEGKALDINHASKILGSSSIIVGGSSPEILSGSDIVVVTAGVARKPGMSRDDLLKINANIVADVAKHLKSYCKNAKVIVVTNPLDSMTWFLIKKTGFEPQRVIGMAGILDSSRFAFHLAEKLNIAPACVTATVLGGHGDDMVPIEATATVEGIPITYFLNDDTINQIKERVRFSGGEIVNFLKTGSAFFSPAASVLVMVRAISNNERRLVTASCYLRGEYALSDLCFGVPCILGKNGVEKIVEIELTENQKNLLEKSAQRVRELNQILKDNL
ncbi:MAG: malate dehydrogenase [Deltaproteobacteria bacterium]|nr:malate dehydrogenase [Deltaproteobacteria bacterium]